MFKHISNTYTHIARTNMIRWAGLLLCGLAASDASWGANNNNNGGPPPQPAPPPNGVVIPNSNNNAAPPVPPPLTLAQLKIMAFGPNFHDNTINALYCWQAFFTPNNNRLNTQQLDYVKAYLKARRNPQLAKQFCNIILIQLRSNNVNANLKQGYRKTFAALLKEDIFEEYGDDFVDNQFKPLFRALEIWEVCTSHRQVNNNNGVITTDYHVDEALLEKLVDIMGDDLPFDFMSSKQCWETLYRTQAANVMNINPLGALFITETKAFYKQLLKQGLLDGLVEYVKGEIDALKNQQGSQPQIDDRFNKLKALMQEGLLSADEMSDFELEDIWHMCHLHGNGVDPHLLQALKVNIDAETCWQIVTNQPDLYGTPPTAQQATYVKALLEGSLVDNVLEEGIKQIRTLQTSHPNDPKIRTYLDIIANGFKAGSPLFHEKDTSSLSADDIWNLYTRDDAAKDDALMQHPAMGKQLKQVCMLGFGYKCIEGHAYDLLHWLLSQSYLHFPFPKGAPGTTYASREDIPDWLTIFNLAVDANWTDEQMKWRTIDTIVHDDRLPEDKIPWRKLFTDKPTFGDNVAEQGFLEAHLKPYPVKLYNFLADAIKNEVWISAKWVVDGWKTANKDPQGENTDLLNTYSKTSMLEAWESTTDNDKKAFFKSALAFQYGITDTNDTALTNDLQDQRRTTRTYAWLPPSILGVFVLIGFVMAWKKLLHPWLKNRSKTKEVEEKSTPVRQERRSTAPPSRPPRKAFGRDGSTSRSERGTRRSRR